MAQNNPVPEKHMVPAAEFNAKFRDKPEVYKFLACDAGVYLPKEELVTVWHLKDLMNLTKARIYAKNVKHIFVPQYEGLTVERMVHHMRKSKEVCRYIPDSDQEVENFPRQYIANICYTVIGEPFYQWVQTKIDARNDRIMNEK